MRLVAGFNRTVFKLEISGRVKDWVWLVGLGGGALGLCTSIQGDVMLVI